MEAPTYFLGVLQRPRKKWSWTRRIREELHRQMGGPDHFRASASAAPEVERLQPRRKRRPNRHVMSTDWQNSLLFIRFGRVLHQVVVIEVVEPAGADRGQAPGRLKCSDQCSPSEHQLSCRSQSASLRGLAIFDVTCSKMCVARPRIFLMYWTALILPS